MTKHSVIVNTSFLASKMWRVLWGKGGAILERVEGAYYVRIEATV